MKHKIFSIIIPTYNSEKFLEKCLKSIKNQNYSYYEIIVVDQQSTDKTISIAKKYKAKIISTEKPKFYSPPNKSRNRGARKAIGDFLYHLDSDMELSKNLLHEALSIFTKHNDIGALMVYEKDKTRGFFSKCKALERKCYKGNDDIDSARIVRKSIFKKISGYDEDISSGEDFSIQQKYKKVCKVTYCRNVAFHDLTNLTFLRMIAKKYNYGKTASIYFKKSKRSKVHLILEEFGMYGKNYKLLLAQPTFALGMILLKIAELFAGFFGQMNGSTYI